MADKLKAACIGLRHGHAKGLIGTFNQLEGVEVVAYCEDTAFDALDALKETYPGAKYFREVDELLDQEDFDVACVALPAVEVPPVGTKLAKAGKHFLMEKQFARTAKEMQPMVEAIRDNGVKVLAHYPWRRHPAVMAMKSYLAGGAFGRPLALHAQLVTSQVRPGLRNPESFAYTKESEGGGILHMLGGHWLEAIRYLMGCEVSAVTAMCRPVVGNMGEDMDDITVAGLEFENGATGSLQAGYLQAAGGGSESVFHLWGTEGSAFWPSMGVSELQVRSTTFEGDRHRDLTFDLASKEGVYGGQQWLFDLAQDLIQAIREDRQPAVTALDAFRVLEVTDAIYQSSKAGRRVEVRYAEI
ncbi:MAG: Gfo/Idh/MocA family oxidoreductase [Planctomycetota bacterium]|nr:Gfo/Idh/MocA family oxidoreductase [Planctomycetota bacterium]